MLRLTAIKEDLHMNLNQLSLFTGLFMTVASLILTPVPATSSSVPHPAALLSAKAQLEPGFVMRPLRTTELTLSIVEDRLLSDERDLGYVDRRNSGYQIMVAVTPLSEKLGYTITQVGKQYSFSRDGYSFTLQPDRVEAVKLFNNEEYLRSELLRAPLAAGDELYLYDADLVDLFGLIKTFDPESGTLTLTYTDYAFIDQNIFSSQGEKLLIRLEGDYPQMLKITDDRASIINGMRMFAGLTAAADVYSIHYEVPINYPAESFDIVLTHKGRLVYAKHFNEIKPTARTHTLKSDAIVGPFSTVRIDSPVKGYSSTHESTFYIKGRISGTRHDTMTVFIDVFDEGSGEFSLHEAHEIELNSGGFAFSLPLSAGRGLYRIRCTAEISGMHGTVSTAEVLRCFVRSTDKP